MNTVTNYGICFEMFDGWNLYYTGLPGRYMFMEGEENCSYEFTEKQAHEAIQEMLARGEMTDFLNYTVIPRKGEE